MEDFSVSRIKMFEFPASLQRFSFCLKLAIRAIDKARFLLLTVLTIRVFFGVRGSKKMQLLFLIGTIISGRCIDLQEKT